MQKKTQWLNTSRTQQKIKKSLSSLQFKYAYTFLTD